MVHLYTSLSLVAINRQYTENDSLAKTEGMNQHATQPHFKLTLPGISIFMAQQNWTACCMVHGQQQSIRRVTLENKATIITLLR